MLTVEQIEAIRRDYYHEHKSVRAIARDSHHGRRVVREAISGAPPPRRYHLTHPKPRPVLDPVIPIIDTWLESDHALPRIQRHTAKRIFDRLVAEHHFTGSERIVRQYVQAWRQTHHRPQPGFVPLSYGAGAEAQCDWGEATVSVTGVEQTAYLFCMRLCFSLKPFVCAFPTTRQECFLAGHVAAFTAFGGVPRRVVYDNLTTAVAKVLQGRTRLEQESFVAFRAHYLFDSHFCLPGRDGAHEKPLVESLVGYARRNFMVPLPAVPSWEALNAYLAERCAAEDTRSASGRPGTIGALWHEEQPELLPLPRMPYPCCRTLAVRASRQSLVTFERNRYSVPSHYAGERLLLRAFAWIVEISDGRTLVARHARLYGRDGEQFDPLHYLALLEQRPGAFTLARPIKQWQQEWPPIYHQYLAALQQTHPKEATREFVRILQLHARYDTTQIAVALARAMVLGCWSAESVELCLHQLRVEPIAAALVDLATLPMLAQVSIPVPDLAAFNQLLEEVKE